MKICIFTGRSIDPLHPRIESHIKFFKKKGYEYTIIPPKIQPFWNRINWLSLWIFDNYTIIISRKLVNSYEVIFLQDLRYLPIAKYAKKNGKYVLYETLDNNVYLRLHSLQKKIPVLKPFMKILSNYFIRKEKKLASKYCDSVIVNSLALKEYFDNKCELIYYTSPLETFNINNNPEKPTAALYLGAFTEDKGALEILDLQDKLGLKLYIIGSVLSEKIKQIIAKSPQIKHIPRVKQSDLGKLITSITNRNFLIGLSLIKPVNVSYATQEANKDIDYLALGIPLIGNHRKTTEEKIIAGCGIFVEDQKRILQLINDINLRHVLSNHCKELYFKNYSYKEFESKLERILHKFI